MKYSLNRINRSRKTGKYNNISFNWYNSYCRASASNECEKINDKEILYLKNFTIKIKHSLSANKHIFIIEEKVEQDIAYNKININDLNNIIYARTYFMDLIKKNPYTQLIKIEKDFIQRYKITQIRMREKMNQDL